MTTPTDANSSRPAHRGSRVRGRVAVICAAVGVVLLLGAASYLWVAPRSDVRANDAAATSPPVTLTPTPALGTPGPTTPAPTPAPTKSTAARSGGKPGPGNTGVPAGTKLTVINGDQEYSTPNQVVNGLDIHGFVLVTAKNVTIKNSIIRGGPNPKCNSSVLFITNKASATVQDVEIFPSYPSPCLDGMWVSNSTLLRLNIHNAVDGLKAFDNVTVQDSYIHDLSWFASDPNQDGGETHNDAVQTYQGNQHIVLRHNTMVVSSKGNAAYQLSQDEARVATDIRIEGNWLDGGGCTLNFTHHGGPTPMTGIYVTNNRFGRGSFYKCPILVSTQTTLSQQSGNVWDDTGAPIPAPSRHD